MTKTKKTIGTLSAAAGVKVTTIRYYEQVGLMPRATRTASGQRRYDHSDVERLRFIRHTRELGFSMTAIGELIELQTRPGTDCTAVDQLARKQLQAVQHRQAQLAALERELQRMVSLCAGGTIGECAVMGCLNDHDHCLTPAHEKPTAL